jgi:hypothetical protein
MFEAGLGGRPLIREYANIVPVRGERVAGQRVVPIGAGPAVGAAQLTYRGGPLIAQVKVYALYWGSAWTSTSLSPAQTQPPTRSALDAFMAHLVTSTYMNLFTEYNVARYTIKPGTFLGSSIIAPDPAAQVSDADIRGQIQQRQTSGDVPPWDANTLYAMFLPSGVTVQEGGSLSCNAFCGYHDAVVDTLSGQASAYYAVLPFPDCAGCAASADGSQISMFDALTSVLSHEVAEAITDPMPGTGWYDDQNGEIGDICAWQLAPLDGYTVQQEWSNTAGTCVAPAQQ